MGVFSFTALILIRKVNPTGKNFFGGGGERRHIRIYLGVLKPKWLKKGPFSKGSLMNFNVGMGSNSSTKFMIKIFFVLSFFFLMVSSTCDAKECVFQVPFCGCQQKLQQEKTMLLE